jgi:hypothetical protein
MSVVWQIRTLRPIHHRIIWWVVDAGAVGKTMGRGWQKECAANLGIHRLTLSANIKQMVKLGVLQKGERRGEFVLPASLIKRTVDRAKVTIKED